MQKKSIDTRMVVHGLILVVLFFFYFWPGLLIANRIEPYIGPFPFSVFWSVIFLPLLNALNLLAFYLYYLKRDKEDAEEQTDG